MVGLPIDAALPEIVATLRAHSAAVIVAPPGSGKTTRVPPALLDAGIAGGGRILVLQPRRVAARLAARRIAEERGCAVGEEVGYAVRFERRVGPNTRIEVITEGLLTRRLQADPFLDGVGVVVLDEFHERSLHVDLGLALLREVWAAGREDLKIVVMSATLDPEPVAAFLGGAPVIRAEGRSFPVRLVYDGRPDERPAPLRCAEAIRAVLREEKSGHVLAFLAGAGEIRWAQERLTEAADAPELVNVDVLPLHSSMRAEEQDRALAPSTRRKVILATNIAETSVTVEGICAVVDTGLARVPRFDPATGLDRLELGRISAASADQRTGRAGRTGPGLCRRLWTPEEQRGLSAFETPEIRRVDLCGAVLELRAWGVDPTTFSWFEAPPPAALAHAEAVLRSLGAVSDAGITALGRTLQTIPAHPRLARVVVAGHAAGCLREAAAAAALASERDPWPREGPPLDLESRIEALLDSPRPPGGVDRGAWRAAHEVTEQLCRSAVAVLGPSRAGRFDTATLIRALLAGFPDRVGRRRAPGSDRLRLVGGAGAVLDPRGDPGTELVLAVVLEAGPRRERAEHRVRLAAPLDRAWLPASAITESTTLAFDPEREAVVQRSETRYLDLVLAEQILPASAQTEGVAVLLAQAAATSPEGALNLDEEATRVQDRVRFLRRVMPELDLPDLDDLPALLPEICLGHRAFSTLRAVDLAEALLARLRWPQRQALDQHAPDRLGVPSGSTVRLDYPREGPPVLAARIQQLFGLRQGPRVADGRMAVLVHLLAPNQRPVQMTQDLASFWANTYAEVRKDLRGRYPKHAWPEDPTDAVAVDRPRRRS